MRQLMNSEQLSAEALGLRACRGESEILRIINPNLPLYQGSGFIPSPTPPQGSGSLGCWRPERRQGSWTTSKTLKKPKKNQGFRVLGLSWSILALSWVVLGPSWVILGSLGPSWRQLGARVGHLAAILCHLGAFWGHLEAILGLFRGR